MNGDTFEDFWDEVLRYSETSGLSTEYLEDEFIIDGELHKVNINYKKETYINLKRKLTLIKRKFTLIKK